MHAYSVSLVISSHGSESDYIALSNLCLLTGISHQVFLLEDLCISINVVLPYSKSEMQENFARFKITLIFAKKNSLQTSL